MHEWSLAEAVISSLIEYMRQEGIKRILSVEITYGEVMELEPDIFEEALRILSENSPLKGVELDLREEKASFGCNSCGAEWSFEEAHKMLNDALGVLEEPGDVLESPLHFLPDLAPALLKCPRCGSRDIELKSGRELKITRVVVEK